MTTRHSFDHLLPKQAACLRRRALKLTGSPHRADDLVQDTLLRAWANRDKFTTGTNLRAWLFTIMRNSFFSSLRKHRREVEDANGTYADTLHEPPRQLDAISLTEVMSAIAALPEIQRRPLVMMGAYGFSQLEAAQACGCTVGTIKSRVSRGRSALGHTVGTIPTPPHQKIPTVRVTHADGYRVTSA